MPASSRIAPQTFFLPDHEDTRRPKEEGYHAQTTACRPQPRKSEEPGPTAGLVQALAGAQQRHPECRLLVLVDDAALLFDKGSRGEIGAAWTDTLADLPASCGISLLLAQEDALLAPADRVWPGLVNGAETMHLGPLGRSETMRLAQEPVSSSIRYAADVPETVYRLTGGQPYYVQLIGSAMVDHLNQVRRNQAVSEDLEAVVDTILREPQAESHP